MSTAPPAFVSTVRVCLSGGSAPRGDEIAAITGCRRAPRTCRLPSSSDPRTPVAVTRRAETPSEPFVIVGISADNDDYAWRRFTVKEQMVWPQFWDRGQDIVRSFGVNGFPTYVLVDGDGIEQLRVTGDGFNRSVGLQKAIAAQIAKLARPGAVHH